MREPQAGPLPVLVYPDPVLTKRARPLTAEELGTGKADGWDIAELVERMKTTLELEQGVGLAATQVGVGLRLFLAKTARDGEQVLVVVNPVFTETLGSSVEEEGCLSVPGVRAKVKRHAAVRVNAVDLIGEPLVLEARDLLARVCQHETDHLDGVLFINRLGMAARLLVRRQLAELEDEYQLMQQRRKRKRVVPAGQ